MSHRHRQWISSPDFIRFLFKEILIPDLVEKDKCINCFTAFRLKGWIIVTICIENGHIIDYYIYNWLSLFYYIFSIDAPS